MSLSLPHPAGQLVRITPLHLRAGGKTKRERLTLIRIYEELRGLGYLPQAGGHSSST